MKKNPRRTPHTTTTAPPVDPRRRGHLCTIVRYACTLRGARLESLARLAKLFAMAGGTDDDVIRSSALALARFAMALAAERPATPKGGAQ